MKLELEKYQKSNTEKLDATTSGVSIEKKHKLFLKKFKINLSALVRDVIDNLMREKEESEEKNHEKD